MKKFILLFCLAFSGFLSAQKTVKQVFVLNEGSFNYSTGQIEVPVSIGAFNPASGQYSKIFEIPGARFASDILFENGLIWVAADKFLSVFDTKSGQIVRQIEIEGIRKIALTNGLVIVTRGEYNKSLDSYIQIYNQNDLSLKTEIRTNQLAYTCENILIRDNQAYIAVNNGFVWGEEVGKLAVIDLEQLELKKMIELGSNAKNPENLIEKNGRLYTLNNKNYTGSSISEFNPLTSEIHTLDLPGITSLCGTSALAGESIYYQEAGKTQLGAYTIPSRTAAPYVDAGRSFYGMTVEEESNDIYAAVTDYKTFGKVYVYDHNFQEKYSFDASVSPGDFAFEYTATSNQNEWVIPKSRWYVAQDEFILKLDENMLSYKLMDLSGNEIASQQVGSKEMKMDVENLNSGLYVLKISWNSNRTYPLKIIIP